MKLSREKKMSVKCPSKINFSYLCSRNSIHYLYMISIVARKTTNKDISSLSVYIKNRQLEINTYVSMKVKILTKEWSAEAQLPKKVADQRPVQMLDGMSYAELGDKILTIKKELASAEECDKLTVDLARQVIRKCMSVEYMKEVEAIAEEEDRTKEKSMTLMEWIGEYIRQCEDGERLKHKSTQMISPGTIKSLKGTQAQLEEYERVRHRRLDFDDMTMDFYDDWKRFFIKKKYSPNTIGRHVKNLKTMLFAAEDMKLTTSQEFKSSRFSVDHEDVDNVYITTERLDEMYSFDMSDYKTMKERAERFSKDKEEKDSLVHALKRDIFRKNLGIARDIFMVGCMTGQRVSDYKRVNSEMIETLRDGRRYIRIVQEKTGKEVFLPLDERLPVILERYGGRLPKIYDQHLNDRIKVVGLLLGWTEPAGLQEHRGVMTYKSKKRFCDALKTHTARRTFATNAYKDGVSLASIMAVTGHGSEAMLRKYLKLDNKERAILAAAEFEKLRKAE